MAGRAAASGEADDDEAGSMIADINVTPLVDVTLVLLIIMMVAAPLISAAQSIQVELPRAASGGETPRTTIALTLRKDGALFLGDQPISEGEAQKKIRAEHASNPGVQAIIAADRGVPYGGVMRLIDLVKSEGITRFALDIDGSGSS